MTDILTRKTRLSIHEFHLHVCPACGEEWQHDDPECRVEEEYECPECHYENWGTAA